MRHEDHHGGATATHGAGGEWRIERQRLRWDVLDAWAQAAQQAGVPATADFNGGDNEGVGYFEVNQKGGWRWNAAKRLPAPGLPAAAQRHAVDRRAGGEAAAADATPTARCAAPVPRWFATAGASRSARAAK